MGVTMSRDFGLKLINVVGIGIEEVLLTAERIAEDAVRWDEDGYNPWKNNFAGRTPMLMLRHFCVNNIPLTIVGEGLIVLRAELFSFPVTWNGEPHSPTHACRITPENGRIRQIEVNKTWIAINGMTINPIHLDMHLGNGALHLEVYFDPQEVVSLPSITPPSGYEPNIVYVRDPKTVTD